MRIWITGEAGFVARHFTDLYRMTKKHEIVNSIYEPYYQYWRGRDYEINIFDPTLKKLIMDADIDLIIHMAGSGSDLFLKDPDGGINRNINGSFKIFQIAQTLNIPVIYLSSLHVFSDQNNGPITENTPLLRPKTLLGISQMSAEQLLAHMLNQYIIINSCELYGNYDKNGSISKLFKSQNSEFEDIYVDPVSVRSYMHINDFVSALDTIIDQKQWINKKRYILGNYSVCFSSILEMVVNMGININYQLHPELDKLPSSQTVVNNLNWWVPLIDIKKGLEMMKDDYKGTN